MVALGIKFTRPLRVLSSSFDGKPEDIYPHCDQLHAFGRSHGLRVGERDTPGRSNLPWTVNYNNEEDTTPESERPMTLWMPIDGAGAGEGEYSVDDIPCENVAFIIHKGAISNLQESIDELFDWVTRKEMGFRARFHRVVYFRGIDAHAEDPNWEAEIQIPLLALKTK